MIIFFTKWSDKMAKNKEYTICATLLTNHLIKRLSNIETAEASRYVSSSWRVSPLTIMSLSFFLCVDSDRDILVGWEPICSSLNNLGSSGGIFLCRIWIRCFPLWGLHSDMFFLKSGIRIRFFFEIRLYNEDIYFYLLQIL